MIFFIFTARCCALPRTPCLWQGSCVSAPRCEFAPQTRGDFTVRFRALPCLWQGSCVSAPRCEFAPQTREILLCAFPRTPLPVAGIGRDAERVFLPAKIPEAYAVALESPVFVQPCGTKSHPDYLFCFVLFFLCYNRTIRGTHYERKYR